ncbi:hypothetical protein [Streptomyces sp. NPDC005012]|uniref:hypothetical protein n=1 Tax=Streptomyces sp. NPDC005012 TaxID=3154558 RepID=UPI0033B4CE11
MFRTRSLVLALLVPLLVTGCVAVAPAPGRLPGDVPPGAAGRPAEERTAPSRGQADLVESGRTSGEGEKEEAGKAGEAGEEGGKGGRGQGGGAAGNQDGAVREPRQGRADALRSQGGGGGRAVGAQPPTAGREAAGAPRSVSRAPRARRKAPAARVRPARTRQPRGHHGRQRPGFRMGEWCRQARGVASSDVVSLCHSAYGR